MTTRHRVRRVLKWLGTVTCALLLVLWIASVQFRSSFFGPDYEFEANGGRVSFSRYYGTRRDIQELRYRDAAWFGEFRSETASWSSAREWTWTQWRWRLGLCRPGVYERTYGGYLYENLSQPVNQTVYVLPCWIPFTLAMVSTALLWLLDRRRAKPGHCGRCGYSLTGNVSGRCPECGTPVSAECGTALQAEGGRE